MILTRNRLVFLIALSSAVTFLYLYSTSTRPADLKQLLWGTSHDDKTHILELDEDYFWARVQQRYPVQDMIPMPSPAPKTIPSIQYRFPKETAEARSVRLARLDAVRGNFSHAWQGYRDHAWMRDEVRPLSGQAHDPFGGWAATLVDTLDTLWIMDLHDEFEEAVRAVAELDFTTCTLDEINVFETTIRYLGGFLGAYDISQERYPVLLQKAMEIGQMLYAAFDTPNRMPITRWKFHDAVNNVPQEAGEGVLVAEIGSLTLEFTRLSQITKDPRWFDAVQRIMDLFDEQQEMTRVPGLWPVVVSGRDANFHESSAFTIGGMADSLYEYLPKQHLLLSGGSQQYRKLYSGAIAAMKSHIFFRAMTKDGSHALFPGDVSWDDDDKTGIEPRAQHLSCFAGGMVALGAQAFGRPEELTVARQLTDGCIWGYESGFLGIMPEIMRPVACEDQNDCPWEEEKWHRGVKEHYSDDPAEVTINARHLPPGVSKIDDGRYILRPEAIESVFILYRITGDPVLQEKAWTMFNSIIKHTTTDVAHAGLSDCTVPDPPMQDRMESFWTAETLKYFYLVFAEPGVVSLDEYVLNTEAHPLRRPV